MSSYIPSADNCSYPVRGGNAILPLIDGEVAFRRICEVVEAARHSVWVTVAFMEPDFEMPDGRGSLFDVLDAAVGRGLDVRAIFWRNNTESDFADAAMFSGDSAHRAMLAERDAKFLIRWDRAQKAYCQHQKSWLIDAGTDSEFAFVGGINLGNRSVVSPGHVGRDHAHTHDIYTQLRGPSGTDVHHNFVQRWNEASERDVADGCWPHVAAVDDLTYPTRVSPARGNSVAQVQRTVRAGHYTDGTAVPAGAPFDIERGELSVFEQYEKAIAAAQEYIYLENQALGQPETVEALHDALSRGVAVTILLPADANAAMVAGRKDPRAKPFFDRIGALAEHRNFLMAGIAAPAPDGALRNIYVHAKTALIDDVWATIGSCNIGARSFFGDTELNVSFWCAGTVRKLRCDLLEEHLGFDTSAVSGIEAMREYREVARANAEKRSSNGRMQGLAFALDPWTYGTG